MEKKTPANGKPFEVIKKVKDIKDRLQLFYVPNIWYSFTISPPDYNQHYIDTHKISKSSGKVQQMTRLGRFKEDLYNLFCNLEDYMELWFNIELSERREVPCNSSKLKDTYSGSRLHVHGKFRFINNEGVKHFLLQVMHIWAHFGRLQIDSLLDMEIWDSYCNKQKSIMRLYPYTNKCIPYSTDTKHHTISDLKNKKTLV